MARLNYLELPVRDIAAVRSFYAQAFGWTFTNFGPAYSATTTGDTDIGLNGDQAQWTAQPLPVIEVENLEEALSAVAAGGGVVTLPIFSFPGGRRFHFRDPAGHELAAMQPDG